MPKHSPETKLSPVQPELPSISNFEDDPDLGRGVELDGSYDERERVLGEVAEDHRRAMAEVAEAHTLDYEAIDRDDAGAESEYQRILGHLKQRIAQITEDTDRKVAEVLHTYSEAVVDTWTRDEWSTYKQATYIAKEKFLGIRDGRVRSLIQGVTSEEARTTMVAALDDVHFHHTKKELTNRYRVAGGEREKELIGYMSSEMSQLAADAAFDKMRFMKLEAVEDHYGSASPAAFDDILETVSSPEAQRAMILALGNSIGLEIKADQLSVQAQAPDEEQASVGGDADMTPYDILREIQGIFVNYETSPTTGPRRGEQSMSPIPMLRPPSHLKNLTVIDTSLPLPEKDSHSDTQSAKSSGMKTRAISTILTRLPGLRSKSQIGIPADHAPEKTPLDAPQNGPYDL